MSQIGTVSKSIQFMNIIKCLRFNSPTDSVYEATYEGWSNEINKISSFCLSCIKLLSFYDAIIVYTDEPGKQFIENDLRIPQLIIRLLPSEIYNPILDKLYACSEQEEPFIFVGNNVFVNSPFEISKFNYDVVVQSANGSTDKAYIYSMELDYFTEDVLYDYDTSIMGGMSDIFFKEFYQYVNKVYSLNNVIFNYTYDKCLYFIYSYLLGNFAKEKSISINFYFALPPHHQYVIGIEYKIQNERYIQIASYSKPLIEYDNIIAIILKQTHPNLLTILRSRIKEKDNLKNKLLIDKYCQQKPNIDKYLNVKKNNIYNKIQLNIEDYINKITAENEKKMILDYCQFEKSKCQFISRIITYLDEFEKVKNLSISQKIISRNYMNRKITLSEYAILIESMWDWTFNIPLKDFSYLNLKYNKHREPDEYIVLFYYQFTTNLFVEYVLDTLGAIILTAIQEPKNIEELTNEVYNYIRENVSNSGLKETLEKKIIKYIQFFNEKNIIKYIS